MRTRTSRALPFLSYKCNITAKNASSSGTSYFYQFPREIQGTVKYTGFSNTFKKVVPHLQSTGKKYPDKKKLLFDIFLLKNGVI